MKNIKGLILVILLVTFSKTSQAQSMLTGNWKVCCLFEMMNGSSTKVCNLCPTIKRQQGVTIQGFEMKIETDSIKFKMDEVRKTVKYTWNDSAKEFEFDYDDSNYKFKVFLTCSQSYILKNKDGQLLLLESK